MNIVKNTPKNATTERKNALDRPRTIDDAFSEMPTPPSERGDRVENRIDCLSNTADLLEKEIAAIRDALDSVLQPDELASPVPTANKEIHPDCQAVTRLRSINSRLLDRVAELSEIRNRLRL